MVLKYRVLYHLLFHLQFQKSQMNKQNLTYVQLKENKLVELKSLTLLKKCRFRKMKYGTSEK
jgi:hypothetical protein